jgi:3-methyl-2-oxobutanoate hydroxymethyltransferase
MQKKEQGEKIVAVTAYDYTSARLFDEFVDVLLIGDSLGMVVQGHAHTLSVRLDDVIYHTKAVAKAAQHAHVVADLPFMTYQTGPTQALKSAGRLLAEGGAEAVKLEGGVAVAPIVEKLVEMGIPVMGHIGLTPQSVHAFGGYKIQGKTDAAKERILSDALALEDAGAYSIVLEGIPAELAKVISERVKVPTIGIGAGIYCDGQILVSSDLLGLNPDFRPRFVKPYANLAGVIREALQKYASEIRSQEFPGPEHSF